jgi:AcrR family transcriptional regulator
MTDVARAAQLTRATVYRHFPNREALEEAIRTEALAAAAAALAGCRLDEGSGLEALRRVIDALSAEALRFRFMLLEGPDHDPAFLAKRARVLAPVLEVVERGQREGSIDADLSPAWVVTSMASLLVAAVRATASAATSASEPDLAALVARTLLRGVAAPGSDVAG